MTKKRGKSTTTSSKKVRHMAVCGCGWSGQVTSEGNAEHAIAVHVKEKHRGVLIPGTGVKMV